MWRIETFNDTERVARIEGLTGPEAIQLGMERHRQQAGRVYVVSPKASWWLIQNNGLTRVGF